MVDDQAKVDGLLKWVGQTGSYAKHWEIERSTWLGQGHMRLVLTTGPAIVEAPRQAKESRCPRMAEKIAAQAKKPFRPQNALDVRNVVDRGERAV